MLLRNIINNSPKSVEWNTPKKINNDGGNGISDIIKADGIGFVAVGWNHSFTSQDGSSWTSPRSGATWNQDRVNSIVAYGIAYGNGIFVTVGGNGNASAATSSNGVTWSSRIAVNSSGSEILGIKFAENLFIAYGGRGIINLSSNGSNWTNIQVLDFHSNLALTSLSYASEKPVKFICCGQGGYIAKSSDGITWTTAKIGSYNWGCSAYNGTEFVVFSVDGYMTKSSDGTNWSNPRKVVCSGITDVCYTDKYYFSGINGAIVALETDFSAYSIQKVGVSTAWRKIKFIDNKFYMVGEQPYVSGLDIDGGYIVSSK